MTAPTTAPAPLAVQAPPNKIATIRDYLEQRKTRIQQIASKNISPDRMIVIFTAAAQTTPKLADCSPLSVYLALLASAYVGLEPNTSTGYAHLIPYWNKERKCFECQYQPDWKGLCQLALATGEYESVDVASIHEHDKYRVVRGTSPSIEHEPKLVGPRGAAIAYYCVVSHRGSPTKEVEVMTREEVEEIRRNYSAQPDGPAWKKSYDEMGKKVVFRRLFKRLRKTLGNPQQERLAAAVRAEEDASMGTAPEYGGEIITASGEVLPETPATHALPEQHAEVPKGTDRAREAVKARAAEIKHGQQQMPLGEKE